MRLSPKSKGGGILENKWPNVRLGELVYQDREKISRFDGGGLPVYGVTNVEGVTETGKDVSKDLSNYLRLSPNRFVYNPYRVNVGSIGVSSDEIEGIVSPAYVVFGVTDNLFPRYLLYFFRSGFGKTQIRYYGNRGSVREALRFKDLGKLEIPLPPLDEQRRIVTKVEGISSRLREVQDLQYKSATELRGFQVAVLTAAFSGRLTADWRERQSPALLPQGKGIIDSEDLDTNEVDLYSLPRSWVWNPLEAVSEYKGGYAYKSRLFVSEENNQVIRIGNVKPGYLDLTVNPVFISEDYKAETEGFRLEKGDLLISQTGTRKKKDYGYVAIVTPENNLFLNQRIGRLRCRTNCLPDYLYYWLQTKFFRRCFFTYETGTANQGNVGADALKKIPIPVAPKTEQEEIIRVVDGLLSSANEVGTYCAQSRVLTGDLEQAVLAKAFSGEL